MGRRGPKAKSDELKEFEGNTGHRSSEQPTDSHERLVGIPEPATYLDDLAAAIFTDTATLLFNAGRLTDADIHAIEQYADSYSQWIQSIKRRDLYAAEHEGEASDRHVKRCRELSSDVNRWSRVLGIGPTYRAGLSGYFGLGGDSSNEEEVNDPILRAVCG